MSNLQLPSLAGEDTQPVSGAALGQAARQGPDPLLDYVGRQAPAKQDPDAWLFQQAATNAANKPSRLKKLGHAAIGAATDVADMATRTVNWLSSGYQPTGLYSEPLIKGSKPGDTFLEGIAGQKDPGAAEVLSGLVGGDLLPTDPRAPAAKQDLAGAFRSWNDKGMGDYAPIAHGIGTIAGFLVGPEAEVGAAAGAVGSQLGRVLESWVGKSIANGTMKASEAVSLMQQGKLVSAMVDAGKIAPEAVKVAKVMEWGGRKIPELMGTTSALVTQSYAGAPEDQKTAAFVGSLMLAPALVPISWAGQRIGQALMDRFVPDSVKATLLLGKDALTNNGIAAATRIQRIQGAMAILGGRTVASLAEAGMFGAVTDQGRKDILDALGGDATAAGRVIKEGLGTTLGILIAKHGVPYDALPYFKKQFPDLNDMQLRMDAKKVQDAKDAEDLQRDQTQEQTAEGEGMGTVGQPTAVEPTPKRAAREGAGVSEQAQARQQVAQSFQGLQKETKSLFRSGWEANPSQITDEQGGPQTVLQFGRDHSMIMQQDSMTGGVKLQVPSDTYFEVTGFAGQERQHETVSPALMKLQGADARQFIQDASMLGTMRRIQGELYFGGREMRDMGNGEWDDPNTGLVHTISLDGKILTRDALAQKWEGSEPLGNYASQNLVYHSPGFDQWMKLTMAQASLYPNKPVNDVMNHVMQLAAFGKTKNADAVRAMLESTTPEQAQHLINEQGEAALAFEFGSVASGHNNPQNALAEMAQMATKQPQKQLGYTEEQPPEAAPTDKSVPAAPEEPVTVNDMLSPEREAQIQEDMKSPNKRDEAGFILTRLAPSRAGKIAEAMDTNEKRQKESGPGIREKYFSDLPDMLAKNAREGGGPFPSMAKTAQNRTRANQSGEVFDARNAAQEAVSKAGPGLRDTVPGVLPSFEMNAYREMVEGRMQPRNEAEADAVTKGKGMMARLFGQAREAGTLRQNRAGEFEPLSESDGGALPRSPAPGLRKVLANPRIRDVFSGQVAEANRMQKAQIDSFLSDFSAGKFEGANREAAFEYFRQLKNWPDYWTFEGKRYQITESNPTEALNKAFNTQTARSAVIKTFGQEGIPPEVRERFGLKGEGIGKAVEEYKKLAYGDAGDAALTLARDLQGIPREGYNLPEPLKKLESWVRAGQTWKAWTYDVGDAAAAAPQLVGAARFRDAFLKWAKNPMDAYRQAVRFQSLNEDMGNYSISESKNPLDKVRDTVSFLGSMSEKAKGALYDVAAKKFTDDLKAKDYEPNEFDDATIKSLGFNDAERASLLNGNSGELSDRLRREMVRALNGQKRTGEGSLIAGSKKANLILRYQKFFINRMLTSAKLTKNLFDAIQSGEGKQILQASQKLGYFAAGVGISGAVGSVLSYLFTDMFRGENGLKRLWSELSYSPGWFIGKMFGSQLVGGPLLQVAVASKQAVQTGGIAGLATATAPGAWAGEIAMLGYGLTSGKGPYAEGGAASLWTLAKRTSLAPGGRELEGVMGLVGLGSGQFDNAMRKLYDWKQMAGIPMEQASGATTQPPNFNRIMHLVKDEMKKDPTNSAAALAAVQPELSKALGLVTGASIADSLLSARAWNGMDEKQRADAMKFLTDQEAGLLYAHDRTLEMVAKSVRKLEGKQPDRDQFDTELRNVEDQTRIGAHDLWEPLAKEAVDRASTHLGAGTPIGDEISRLSASMAAFPETLDKVFSGEKELKAIQYLGANRSGPLIEALLLRRVAAETKKHLVEKVLTDAGVKR